jgi:Divergent InlB B-repeat domain
MRGCKRTLTAALCAGLACLALAGAAQGAPSDPLFVFVPPLPPPAEGPPPAGNFQGPCGLGVDSSGRFYVSDYYHHAIDAFSPPPVPFTGRPTYQGQLAGEDPLDGPCALAFDSSDHLYVNNFHRNVVKFGPLGAFGTGTVFAGPGASETHTTGVAVDPTSGRVYVDERTFIGVYDSTGAPVEEAGQPLRIGEGSLGDGYGLAVSRFPATAARLYVPDASTNTVKVYDPAALDKSTPVQTIKALGAGFSSLRDAAIAVDWSTGVVYVVDNLQPAFTEKPQAQVDVFSAAGSFLGVLKYKIVDAQPPGLAVDNSTGATQGRVYVTSGNTVEAGVYAYGPGAQTSSAQPPSVGLSVVVNGSGEGSVTSDLGGMECSGSCETQIRSEAKVTLRADPAPGSSFAGWSGAGCEGIAFSCTLTLSEAASVTASFQPLIGLPSSVEPSGSAARAASSPAGARGHRSDRRRVRHGRNARKIRRTGPKSTNR